MSEMVSVEDCCEDMFCMEFVGFAVAPAGRSDVFYPVKQAPWSFFCLFFSFFNEKYNDFCGEKDLYMALEWMKPPGPVRSLLWIV